MLSGGIKRDQCDKSVKMFCRITNKITRSLIIFVEKKNTILLFFFLTLLTKSHHQSKNDLNVLASVDLVYLQKKSLMESFIFCEVETRRC